MAIKLLKTFLEMFVDRCGEVIEISTNVGEFAEFITKDCYPKGLNRESFIESVAIHRMLEGVGGGPWEGASPTQNLLYILNRAVPRNRKR